MYYGHYDRVPESAKTVAKAFYAGRACKRSNCETDGETYWLKGNEIARRIDAPKRIARKLSGEFSPNDRWDFPTVAISWAGWYTWITARHLRALGFEATPPHKGSGAPALINGRYARKGEMIGWMTAEQIATWPRWFVIQKLKLAIADEIKQFTRTQREARSFQQLTYPLF